MGKKYLKKRRYYQERIENQGREDATIHFFLLFLLCVC